MDANTISAAEDSAPAHPSPARPPAARDGGDAKRVRVTRACDRCKKRKTRCTGLQPCRLCVETSSRCTFDTAYLRGKAGAVATSSRHRSDNSAFSSPHSQLSGLEQPSPVAVGRNPHHHHDASPEAHPQTSTTGLLGIAGGPPLLAPITIPTTEPVSRASPDPVQTDLEGHYVGPSSGVSFLLRIQKRLDQFVSFSHDSSIFTFGDAPLPYLNSSLAEAPYCDPTFYMLLSTNDTTALVKRYFEFAVPVDRFLHQPTIESWLAEFYESMGTMHGKDDASARIAVLFMVFALAQSHMTPKPTAVSDNMSIRYFHAANQHLSREQGAISLASVQARLCQCLWLLSESRINHCWNLFGTATRLAYAIGLHRKRYAGQIDHIEVECRQRTFWSAYALDNYLSTALGRPRTFHDDDIDQGLPSCVDDHTIHVQHMDQYGGRGQSVMFGPVAYAKLSRILSLILRNIYTIHPTSRADKHAFAAKHTQELIDWRADMSHFLDPASDTAPLIPIYKRQKNVLNLAYWHTMILTHRPFLLRNFAQLQNSSRLARESYGVSTTPQTEQSIHYCLQAATNIVRTVDDMFQAGQLFRAYWFTSYFAFSASVILYIYAIQKSNEPEETYSSYFADAVRCQEQLASLAEDQSLAARYCVVLEELHIETLRQTRKKNCPPPPLQRPKATTFESVAGAEASPAVGDRPAGPTGPPIPNIDMAEMADIEDLYVTPTDSLADMTSWTNFEGMVSASWDGLQFNL